MAELTSPQRPDASPGLARRRASHTVTHRLVFFAHAVAFSSVILLLLVVAGFHAALVVALAWGIALAVHAFYALAVPELRRRWAVDEHVRHATQQVDSDRARVESRHARSLEALSASIAHEIRNPITAAKSLVQQMSEDFAAPENPEFARVALEELDRVERAVAHLLKYARDEEMHRVELDLAEVVSSALSSLAEPLGESGVTVVRSLEPGARVNGDREMLRRVVMNLVTNAVDALAASSDSVSAPDARHLWVTTGQSLSGKESWLEVADDGPGIDADRRARIFDPFYTSKKTGTGLGLAITRKIVEAHGGAIEVDARAGGGAKILVTLPASRASTR